ncbi:hypothetical protein [Brevibacillus laterosporus]|uniref:hypothetical protein n=1 Tax=Brevibacillus laterosporus TaxID=1465 RepID=UPI0018F88BDA|nr:hypothetical protein [Brevibacillus laterosporus]MBG9776126.1 hypothetical protein [Brevibacillus laterosporus]
MSTRKQVVEGLKHGVSIYSDKSYKYGLAHTYNLEKRTSYFRSRINPIYMDALIALIQFEMSEKVDKCYSMDQEDVINILSKFFGVIKLDKQQKYNRSFVIDLYCNWEMWCGSRVWEVEQFKKEGMIEELQKIFNDYKEGRLS